MTKYIFVSGGVISGLGKGITTASIALLLKSKGIRVTCVKCDAYMNVDAGTIRPQEHGEVFVTDDGLECDQDIGNYERFINSDLKRANYLTNGMVYQEIIRKERAFEYEGEDVEIVPHVPEEMIRRFEEAGRVSKAEVVLIEIGGTVGEYQNILFIEANRIMKYRHKNDVIHVHVGYLPIPSFLGEMKSKPVQTSVRTLMSSGVMPDFIIGRADTYMDEPRRATLARNCSIDVENIISNPNVDTIYRIPGIFKDQQLDDKIIKKLNLQPKKNEFSTWHNLIKKIDGIKKTVKIAMVGKYFDIGNFTLSDSYISVIEAVKHGAWANQVQPEFTWINSADFEKNPANVKKLADFDGVIIPQGWGSRGVEGKIAAIRYLREKKIPFLGLCFGMQMAVIEFARHVCRLDQANSEEVNSQTKYPVIHIMPRQKEYLAKHQYGGTIRLGAYPCVLQPKTKLAESYLKYSTDKSATNQYIVSERHRHRYEFNNKYRKQLEKAGLIIAGTSPDGELVEAIELSNKIHPFFVGVQFHPEYKSRPLAPHPLFVNFIKHSLK
ncbi:MAG: CTP synthase [Patescibacteria group bacterium]